MAPDTQIKKYKKIISALNSFSENLLSIDHTQQDYLLFLLLSSALDILKGSRASFLKYDKESNILYNKKTIKYKNGSPVLEQYEDKLKYLGIRLDNEYRSLFLADRRTHLLNNAVKEKALSTEIDDIVNVKLTHIIFYPVYYQENFVGLMELVREEKNNKFNNIDKNFFQILLNFSSLLISNIYLYEWAIHDMLTNCYTITYFNKTLDEYIAFEKRHNESFCLMMLDIDNFKKINDTYGHPAGDKAIVFFSDILKRSTRDSDVLGRYGGDEFCLILRKCTIKGAKLTANRIIHELKKNKLILNVDELHITASIGLVRYGRHGFDRKALIENADTALYNAKKKGKNCFAVFKTLLNTN
jgi:diguanylate cyclase (GGDEF)-like protein